MSMDAMIDWVEPAAHIATVGVLFISIWTLSRNSFDSMFTQLLANHNSIYEKVSAEYFHKFYKEFQKEFKCSNLIQANEIRTFYGRFTSDKENNLNNTYLQAYFKFIYHEITAVRKARFIGRKKFYTRLIQSQMSNEELFCYLINQINHCSGKDKYKSFLRKKNFFKDLYNSEYRNDLNKIKTILLEPLIKKNLLD